MTKCPSCGEPDAIPGGFCRRCGAAIGPPRVGDPSETTGKRPGFWSQRSKLGKAGIVVGVIILVAVIIPDVEKEPSPSTTTQQIVAASVADPPTTTQGEATDTTARPATESAATPAASSTTVAWGETAERDGIQVTVGPPQIDEGAYQVEGKTIMVVEVTVRNTSPETQNCLGNFFKAYDGEGFGIESYGGRISGDRFYGGPMPGETAERGVLDFAVPIGSDIASIIWMPIERDRTQVTWTNSRN